MVHVYKTTVQSTSEADSIIQLILNELPSCDISFDLEDCDNVLRIESNNGEFDEKIVKRIFEQNKHKLETLPV